MDLLVKCLLANYAGTSILLANNENAIDFEAKINILGSQVFAIAFYNDL